MTKAADLLIVGGGLAGGLLALALRERQPGRRVILIDGADRFGGNHLWSFFDGDVAAEDRWLVEPLICHRWQGHDIRFPGLKRSLQAGYQSIESERLDALLRERLAPENRLNGAAVAALDARGVTLKDGRYLPADVVVDARGMTPGYATLELGWQKFLGQLLRLAEPHGLTCPCIMDATVDQTDGYRFLYLLPFGPQHLFVEDTYYRTDPVIDREGWAERIRAYASAQGWQIEAIEREEAAALPIAMGGDFADLWPTDDGVGRIGMTAGLFQPMTGYSLPDAVRTATLVANEAGAIGPSLSAKLRAHARAEWDSRGYYRLLARLLFHAAAPADRWRMLARFYSLSPGLIARFYAGRSTALDKVRLLAGKPPVPVGRALTVMKEHMA